MKEKLYKCIPFSASYWPYVADESRIRFATIPELLNGNDKEEFDHRWASDSPSFQYVASEIRQHYDSLYLRTVILSMGKSPNRDCWNEYCRGGGLRYEFEYDPTHQKVSEVSCKDVAYDDNKTFSLAKYMALRGISAEVQRLFESTEPRSAAGNIILLQWLKSGEPNRVTLNHASDEIPFKKKTRFAFENEYRFVHLTSQIGPNPLKTQLENQKVPLSQIGLKLVRIATSDVDLVKATLPKLNVEVCEVDF